MDTQSVLTVALVAAVAVLVFQAVQINDISKRLPATGLVAASGIAAAPGTNDMSGWTENEKMMYEHHGTIPSRLQQSTASGSIDMAGWTENEKMMYEHHGTVPSRASGSTGGALGNLPDMVGGC